MIRYKSDNSDAVLIVSEIAFWREEKGADLRIAGLCRALCGAGFSVGVFFCAYLTREDRRLLRDRFPGLEVVHPPWSMLFIRMLRRRLGLFRRADEPPSQPLSWERRIALRRCCLARRPRFLIVEYLWSAYLVAGLREGLSSPPLLILDTLDVMHLRAARFEEQGIQGAAPITREDEAAILSTFDVLLAIQDREATELRAMCPETPVVTVGYATVPHPPKPEVSAPVRLLFVAGGGTHNRDAILSFIQQVWVELQAVHGEAIALHIAGHICSGLDVSSMPPGVVLRGFVEDLAPLYGQSHIAVNPVYAGSGLKIKNVEALCHAVPLVTTSVGAEGLEEGVGNAFVVCDSPETMRDALDHLIRDTDARKVLAEGAHAFAQAHLCEAEVYGELLDFLGRHRCG